MRTGSCLLWVLVLAHPLRGQLPTFSEVAAERGITFVHHDPDFDLPDNSWWVGTGATSADYDLDGDLDIYIVDAFGYPNQLYRNDGDSTFTEVGAQAGVADTGAGHMALFIDLDNDGDKDLIVANNTQGQPGLTTSKLFRNEGDGSFSDVTDGSGFDPQGVTVGGMSVTDLNEDGWLDVYIVFWDVELGTPNNYFYRNQGDFQFTDVTESAGLRGSITQTFNWTPVFADFTGDGMQDLFGAVDFDPNYFFIHKGPGNSSYLDRTNQADVKNLGNDMGAAVGDCNGDGLLDIYTTNITPEPPDEKDKTNVLYINHLLPNAFTEEAIDRGVWQTYWGWGTVFFDAELDGDLDLYAVGGRTDNDYYGNKPARLFINNGEGYFDEKSEQCGVDDDGDSRGLVALDFDGDLDQDLLIVNVMSPAKLLQNDTQHSNHALVLELVGTSRSRDAIGARVHLTAGGHTQYREVIAGASFLAGPPLDLHFGVGNTVIIDEVVINWPGGAEDTLINVPVDRKLVITEAQPPAPESYALSVTGPAGIYENSTGGFTSTAENYFALPADVTDAATWTVLTPASAASFGAGGKLTVGELDQDTTITVQASFEGWIATQTVTLFDSGTIDTIAPSATITVPAESSWTTSESTVMIQGTAADNVAVISVTWAGSGGQSGPCSGTSNWSTGLISLMPGENLITITARDAAGNTGVSTLTVLYAPPVENANDNLATPTEDNGNLDVEGNDNDGIAINENTATAINDNFVPPTANTNATTEPPAEQNVNASSDNLPDPSDHEAPAASGRGSSLCGVGAVGLLLPCLILVAGMRLRKAGG